MTAPAADTGTAPLRLALAAMATRFELAMFGDEPHRLRAIGEAALFEIDDCDAAISPFRPGSAIARVNREAHERPVRVDGLTFRLLERCTALHAATGGAFDVTVGPLLRALGFRGEPPASADALAEARAAVGMQHVELDPEACTVRFARAGMAIDVGAIGKGFALDLAADVLREHAVAALLHGGTSTVIAVGAPPGLAGFRVGIGPWPDPPVATLRELGLSVSAAHGRTVAGRGHVIDPRTGEPAAGPPAAAAVLARSATDADAWSTALCAGTAAAPPAGTTFLVAHGAAAGTALRWRRAGDPGPRIVSTAAPAEAPTASPP